MILSESEESGVLLPTVKPKHEIFKADIHLTKSREKKEGNKVNK